MNHIRIVLIPIAVLAAIGVQAQENAPLPTDITGIWAFQCHVKSTSTQPHNYDRLVTNFTVRFTKGATDDAILEVWGEERGRPYFNELKNEDLSSREPIWTGRPSFPIFERRSRLRVAPGELTYDLAERSILDVETRRKLRIKISKYYRMDYDDEVTIGGVLYPSVDCSGYVRKSPASSESALRRH